MKDRAMRDHAHKAVDNLARIDRAMDQPDASGKTILERMTDHEVGHPRSPSFEAGTGPAPIEDLPDELRGRLSYNDPTGQAGVQVAMLGDKAATLRKEIGKRLRNIERDSEFILQAFALFTPRPANVIERLEDKAEPGCASCSRVPGPGTVGRPKREQQGWFSAVTRHTKLADGRKVDLCNFCYEAKDIGARWTGELPPVTEIEYLRDNGHPRRRSA